MAYTFDGPNKKIQLTGGVTSVEVSDMYSRWVDWLLTPGDNSKYLLAMRIVGGDPISDIKNLGLTFFLTNGWRIVPESTDYRLTLIGNLVTDPSGFSPVDTVSGYSIIVEYSVSNLVDSTLAQMPEIEYASFQDGVHINVTGGQAGTTYPIGTSFSPVDNLSDAKTIAVSRGFDKLFIHGNITIGATDVISDYHLVGDGASFNISKTIITLTDGCITLNTSIDNAKVLGRQNGENIYNGCVIGELTNTHSQFKNCGMVGPIQLYTAEWLVNHTIDLIDCHTTYPGWYVVDYNGSPVNQVYTDFSGRIKFLNCTDSRADIIIRLDAGIIWLDSSCTAGNFTFKGIGTLINNITGGDAIIDATGLIDNTSITEATWQNPTRTLTQGITGGGATAQEVWEHQGRTLTAGTRDSEIDAIKAKTDNLPGGIKKNIALPYFTFSMISAIDGKTLLPGLVVTAQRKIDAGAFASCANAPVGVGNGVYLINLEASDLNGDMITLRFTATDALDRVITIKTDL